MVLGMIFNVMVAVPLVLMVIQFARTKQPEERRRPVARRPEDVWATYQRTMGVGAHDGPGAPSPASPSPSAPAGDERPAAHDRSSRDGRSSPHPLVEPRIVPRRSCVEPPSPRSSTAPISAVFRPAR